VNYWIALYVLMAAIIDLRQRRIPNSLTYSGIIIGLVVGVMPQYGPDFADSLFGLAVAFVPSLLLFAVGSIGGGDVKLLSALGALLGYPLILDMMFYAIVFGSIWGLAIIIWRGRLVELIKGLGLLLQSLIYPGSYKIVPIRDLSIPFGLPIAAGTLWAVFDLGHSLPWLIGG